MVGELLINCQSNLSVLNLMPEIPFTKAKEASKQVTSQATEFIYKLVVLPAVTRFN